MALPSAQKIQLVLLVVASQNVEGSHFHIGSVFLEGLSCAPLFFEPPFSMYFQISYRARIQSPFTRYSCIFFGAPKSSSNTYSYTRISPLCHEITAIFTSEENDRNSSPLSGCSSKLRAFLWITFRHSNQPVDCCIHPPSKIVKHHHDATGIAVR
mgnify:CR=1 FL=1